MQAGRMRYKIQIFSPALVTNDYGEEIIEWTLTNTVHAERVKQSGRRSFEVGEAFSDYTTEFNIRYAHTVEENWRVQQLGGYLYTVVSIIPNIDKGYKTLVCERVNE